MVFNPLGCMVSLNDLCDRPPLPLVDRGRPARHRRAPAALHPDPHVPHGWEAQVMFDETTRTLFCGDLFTQIGDGPAIVHDADMIQPALDAEDMFGGDRPHRQHGADAAAARRRSSRVPWRSCTDPPSPATASRRCSTWPTPTRPASPPRSRRRWRDAPGAHHRHRRPLHRGVARGALRPHRRRHPHAGDHPRHREGGVARRRHRRGRGRPLQGHQQAGPWPELEQQAGDHRARARPGDRVGAHRAGRRHRRVALPVRARGHRHPGDRVVPGGQAAAAVRLVHHRHALRPEGPPDRPAQQHGPHARPHRRDDRAQGARSRPPG